MTASSLLKLIFVLFTICFLLLSSCQHAPEVEESHNSDNTNSNDIPSNSMPTNPAIVVPLTPYQQIDTPNSSSSVALIFLIDETKSVLDCRDKAFNRHSTPLYFLSLMDEISESNALDGAEYFIGVSQFAEEYNELLPPTSISRLLENSNWEIWHPVLVGNAVDPSAGYTYYEQGLAAASDTLMSLDVDRKIIILLTDGFIEENLHSSTRREFVQMNKDGIETFVARLCPFFYGIPDKEESSMVYWEEEIDPLEGVTVLTSDDPSDWIETILGLVDDFLPEHSGWVNNQAFDEEHLLPIPGYVKATLHIKEFQGTELHFETSEGVEVRQLPFGVQCAPREVNIVGSPDFSGFYWIDYYQPEISASVKFSPATNDQFSNFSIEIIPENASIDDVTNLRACFDIDLQPDENAVVFRTDDCSGDSKSLCPHDSYLDAHWEWKIPNPHGVHEIQMSFRMLRNDGMDVFSDLFPIPVHSRAEFVEALGPDVVSSVYEGENPRLLHQFTYPFEFAFDVSEPEIFAITLLEQDDLKYIGEEVTKELGLNWTLCPLQDDPDQGILLEEAHHLSKERTNAYFVENGDDGARRYSIMAFRYIIEKCGYDSIIFHWPTSDGVVASTWKCNLMTSSDLSPCTRIPNP